MTANSRQVALEALRLINRRGVYADVALDRTLQNAKELNSSDRSLATELVYGATRRQRSLDAVIDRFARQPASKQAFDLRLILHLGIYQLCYLDSIPESAAVNTSVELAKQNKLVGLAGLVNGILRSVARAKANHTLWQGINDLGIIYSFPDWLIQLWMQQFGDAETAELCQWFNQSPHIDLRVNRLRTTTEQVVAAFESAGITTKRLPYLPLALRLTSPAGAIENLPGFAEGWWSVQDASAQLAAYLLDPQPHEVVIDACAAPGGKTTHIAELMQDSGTIWACDRAASRLKRLEKNCDRLQLQSIRVRVGESQSFTDFYQKADRVLLDVPCSGLGTLHRHADARWRQTPEEPYKLAALQTEILEQACHWVKPNGCLVYSTCTLHPAENEEVIQNFLSRHPNWQIVAPSSSNPAYPFLSEQNWLKVLPHKHDMDGFFLVKLEHTNAHSE